MYYLVFPSLGFPRYNLVVFMSWLIFLSYFISVHTDQDQGNIYPKICYKKRISKNG
jgi:hypothetical protein